MKQSVATARRIAHKIRPFGRSLLIITVMLVSLATQFAPSIVQALTPAQKKALDRGIKYYDTESCEVPGSNGGIVTATGPAAEILKKVGMDPGWVNLIIKYATQYQTDPIAMATLMYWENRGFPKYAADTSSFLIPHDEQGGRAADGSGRGPWQFIRATWEGLARQQKELGPYRDNVYSADISTRAAAIYVKSEGGGAGNPLGWIGQNFGKGANLPSMATVAKNYNAGPATYRTPAVAEWRQDGRSWVSWGSEKARIIDDYIVGTGYAYYQIATGTVPNRKDDKTYLDEALKQQEQIKKFKYVNNGDSASPGTPSAPNTPTATGKSIIVLDPGHATRANVNSVDVGNGRKIGVLDYDNGAETQDAWQIAQEVKKQLEAEGYGVVLTKENALGTDSSGKPNTNLKQRADVATQNKAALGISIHTTPGSAAKSNVNFVPKVGNWRAITTAQPTNGNKDNPTFKESDKEFYKNSELAEVDLKYANIFAETRGKALGGDPSNVQSYEEWSGGPRVTSSGGITSAGTVLVTQYFATTPWVYMEQAQDSGTSLTKKSKDAYIKGIVDGVKKAIPVNGGTADANAGCNTAPTTGTGGVQAIVQKAVELAWPEPFDKRDKAKEPNRVSPTTPKPEYLAAVKSHNKSVGTSEIRIADCGIFVATVMRASGADPDFPPVYTPTQEKYVRDHPDKYEIFEPGEIKDVGQLVPGDILIINAGSGAGAAGHIYLFIGKQENGYNSASASYLTRSGNLGMAYLSDSRGAYMVARPKQ